MPFKARNRPGANAGKSGMLKFPAFPHFGQRSEPIEGCFGGLQEAESRFDVVAGNVSGLLIEIALGQGTNDETPLQDLFSAARWRT